MTCPTLIRCWHRSGTVLPPPPPLLFVCGKFFLEMQGIPCGIHPILKSFEKSEIHFPVWFLLVKTVWECVYRRELKNHTIRKGVGGFLLEKGEGRNSSWMESTTNLNDLSPKLKDQSQSSLLVLGVVSCIQSVKIDWIYFFGSAASNDMLRDKTKIYHT